MKPNPPQANQRARVVKVRAPQHGQNAYNFSDINHSINTHEESK